MSPRKIQVNVREADLSQAELDHLILSLESQLAPKFSELKRLKRRRAALAASKVSGEIRRAAADKEAHRVYAAWKELGSTRGAIPILMENFRLTERTVLRRLERAGRGRDRDDQRERMLDDILGLPKPRL